MLNKISLKINLLNYKYLVKLSIEVIEKYKMTKNNKIIIYLKRTNIKFDKYIKHNIYIYIRN